MIERLLIDERFTREVASSVRGGSRSVDILVGFAKTQALEWLADHIVNPAVAVSVVVGWTPMDLICGASDVDAYLYARRQGWKFGIRPDLHAKIFWVDRQEILMGSANLTTRGLHLGVSANIEAGVRVTPTNVDTDKLSRLIETSIWLDDTLFEVIRRFIADAGRQPARAISDLTWPASLEKRLIRMSDYLWVDDLLMTNPVSVNLADENTKELIEHDKRLLGGLYINAAPEQLAKALRCTKVIRWLTSLLQSSESGSARFGTVSAALHDALMDDPRPYRRDIKSLQDNLFQWIKYAGMSEFELRQHRRTTSIHLTR